MTTSFKNFFFLILSGSLLISSCASSKSAGDDQKSLPSSLLWKIEHPDLSQPSYVFGTIHMIPKEDFFYPTGLDEAYEKSKQVVFEIDLDDMTGIGSLMGMLGNIMMKDGMTLNKLLTPEEFNEVAAYFEGMGLPMFMLSKVKPMFLSMLAEVNMNPEEMQSGEIVSYEMEIYDRAQKDKKIVGGLETMEYQMSLFDSIPYKDQAEMLLDAVRGTSAGSDSFDETVDLYKLQDIEKMVAMVSEADNGDNYEDILLKNRNENWIPVMSNLMKNGPIFFAVGAGHLAGDYGVIRLLRKAGYSVTPVSVHKTVAAKQRV